MMNNDEQQVIALAATLQALSTVQSVATNGEFDEQNALPIFYSLINYNPEDTLSAYNGNILNLRFGLNQIKKFLSDALDRDLAQYILAVISIERKLVNHVPMRQLLQNQIQNLSNKIRNESNLSQVDNFESDSENTDELEKKLISNNTIAELAELYKKTASTTEPRIIVKGNQQFLQSEVFANQIRALLLGALRGVAFFRHYGGKRVDFMMKRKQYLDIINHL